MAQQDVQQVAAAFEDLLWCLPPEKVASLEMAASGYSVSALLANFSAESLAVAFLRGFFALQAIRELTVVRYGEKLKFWCRKRTANENEAEELFQECYLKVLIVLNKYDPDRAFFHSFYWRVVRNRWLELLRRQAAHRGGSLDGIPEPSDGDLSPEDQAAIKEALDKLPEDQRTAFELAWEGKKPKEIADHMGIPIRRVYRLIYCARQSLKPVLRPV